MGGWCTINISDTFLGIWTTLPNFFVLYLDDDCDPQELGEHVLKWKKISTVEAHAL
jgi:hypothetical protein